MARILAVSALCLGLAAPVAGQAPDPRLEARWDADPWLTAGAVAGVAAGSFLVEEEVRRLFQGGRSGVADALERVGWWYGTPLFTVPASLLTLAGGALFDDDDVQDTGLLMSGVLLSVLAVQQPVRIVVGRARPSAGEGHLSFDPFSFGNSHASFVSGHTWSAFGISNVVARQVDRPWATVCLYSLATVTALSRLYADQHWLTDVVLGAVAGYAIGTALWKENRKTDNGNTVGAGATPAIPFLVLRLEI